MKLALALVILALSQAAVTPPTPPAGREIAPGTYLLPGAMLPERGPDGNTVILAAPDGLIVIDTGRHPWHSDGILAFAREKRLPIAAIVNTHWHLDHSSGNARLKSVHPKAQVYTSSAVVRALGADGFLTRNLEAARKRQPDEKSSAIQKEETALFFATMERSAALRPDVPVNESGTRTLAGRPLAIRVASDAVTDGDLWLFDEPTGVAVIGDLVTMPAPFFETACPARWEAALDEVWATPFRQAVPGHGAPMTRVDFDVYRQAFRAFRACASGGDSAATCASGWVQNVGPLLGTDDDRRQASTYAAYYVDFLRKNDGASPDCRRK